MNMKDDAAHAAPGRATPVCAIGASAGGVEALQTLFAGLPPDLGLAYVVVVHLAPDHPSRLAGILAARTPMAVRELDEETTLVPDRVYVIPPNRELVIEDDHVSARPFAERRGRRAPIDLFFRSVAAARGDSLAVVLSGAGTDGTLGVRAIKAAGGVVLVQEPREALHPTMPGSALATGIADVVAPVAELAERIADLVRNAWAAPALGQARAEDELRRIVGILRLRSGHDFSSYKRATLGRRVLRRMQLTRRRSLADYADHLQENPAEAQALFDDLLISVTRFFRDPQAFRVLAERAVPALFERPDGGGELRVWVVGCATGEEAYSIAILLLEEMSRRGVTVHVQVFATDLDERALAVAREGRYPKAIEADVPEDVLGRFFTAEGGHYVVNKDVRDLVLFASHSALRDPPFLRLDLVACRNVLIYLERDLQRQLAAVLHYALKPGGHLFLGAAETVDAPGLFAVVDREARLYRAEPRVGPAPPALPQLPVKHGASLHPSRSAPPPAPPAPGATAAHLDALEGAAPPSVLVDAQHRVLHLSPAAGRYFLPDAGPFTADLAALVRPELRLDLRAGLHRVFERREATVTPPLEVSFDGTARRVVLQVAPAPASPEAAPRALVFFLEGGPVPVPAEPRADEEAKSGEGSAPVRHLRAELAAARERLQVSHESHEQTVQELRAANEQLQSVNEEYRSTSEELETSTEELRSMNEELRTVNAELRSQVECMAAANSDLQNLIQATEAAALFLDTGLRIRMFTLQVANIFNITAADEGRAITEFTQRLVDVDVEREAAKVLRNLTPVETEVATTDGRRLMLCLRPYRTVDDGIDGVVATFVDVTERRRATARLRDTEDLVRRSWDLLARVAAGSSWGWGTWDLALGAASWDGRARELLGLGAAGEASAEAWLERMHADDRAAVERELEAAVRERRCFEVVARVPRADDGVRTVEAVGVVLGDAAGRPVRGTVLLRDATDADGAARP